MSEKMIEGLSEDFVAQILKISQENRKEISFIGIIWLQKSNVMRI